MGELLEDYNRFSENDQSTATLSRHRQSKRKLRGWEHCVGQGTSAHSPPATPCMKPD